MIQIAQDISSRVHVKKRRRSGLRRGFLTCTIGEIDKSRKIYPAPFAVKLYEGRETVVEPDISVICGYGKLTEQGCTGAPDWVIEIVSPTNPGNAYVRKLNLYADAGKWIYKENGKHEEGLLVILNQRCRRIASFGCLALTQISGTDYYYCNVVLDSGLI